MEPFRKHRGIVAWVDRANIDTDAIVPKQFLKATSREGFGQHLFFEWRYLPDGQPNPIFILNRPPYDRASVLLARNNFGCGSSREHAVWAIAQFGFRAVIVPWKAEGAGRIPAFADIFRNNCAKNGLLTVELAADEVDAVFQAAADHPGMEVTVDLEQQAVVVHGPQELRYRFEMDPAVRQMFLSGQDAISKTLEQESAIAAFEARHDVQLARG